MKKAGILCLVLLVTLSTFAQTKIFKEVNDEISSQMKVISQNGALMGYLLFTELEKANADSFNYKITIMDENLNDIGVVNFRDRHLNLQGVSFEQDILCLAYLKSSYDGQKFRNNKEQKKAKNQESSSVYLQFINLEGRIIKTQNILADLELSRASTSLYGRKSVGTAKLKDAIQLQNLPGAGFVCFYQDQNNTNLLVYNTNGGQTWQKYIKEGEVLAYHLLTSGRNIYLLLKKENRMDGGGYELIGYNTEDSTSLPRYALEDKAGKQLRVMAFANDPATGKPYLSGNIIDPSKGNRHESMGHYAKAPYCGVFTVNINGNKKTDIKPVFSYWEESSGAAINNRGRIEENKSYVILGTSFRDYNGNTYFAGSGFIRRTRWGGIAASVITAPLILPPIFLLSAGTTKHKITDAILLKQNTKGALSFDNSIESEHSIFIPSAVAGWTPYLKNFYTVTNSDNKSNYLVVEDTKSSIIYNVNQRKIIRTIPYKEGRTSTNVFPAKEGHIMVMEYNKKEKTTRLSIEAL